LLHRVVVEFDDFLDVIRQSAAATYWNLAPAGPCRFGDNSVDAVEGKMLELSRDGGQLVADRACRSAVVDVPSNLPHRANLRMSAYTIPSLC
jgi:hypothetical protein